MTARLWLRLRCGLLLWLLFAAFGFVSRANIAYDGHSTVAAKMGRSGLVHLTDDAGLAGINQSGSIVGSHGVFAVPGYVTAESTAMKVARTGLSPAKTAQYVPIPQGAQQLFQQPMPIALPLS